MIDKSIIFQKYKKAEQEHVFRFYEDLSPVAKEKFLKELDTVDLNELSKIYSSVESASASFSGQLEAAQVKKLPVTKDDLKSFREAFQVGEDLLKKGKVACFVVAGGQGSRLGFEGPKGAFNVKLPSEKSLFELQADQIAAASRYYNTTILWYIMTSQTNHAETVRFFEDHKYFSVKAENVRFFSQDMLPAVDKKGKLILSAKDSLFLSPNGHGGSLLALERSGALKEMKAKGIEFISYYQVDNILIKIFDPAFIGFHAIENAELSFKMVKKRNAEEKVGVVAKQNGLLEVIEYSDLPVSEMHAKDNNGELKFWSGSIAIHLFSVNFISRIVSHGFELPYHKAEKSIPYVNEAGELITPKEKNGIKFETFVFDAIKSTKHVFLLEVDRDEEFGPVKNKDGEDSPETARQMYMERCRRNLLNCTKNAELLEKIKNAKKIEINQLSAFNIEELSLLVKGQKIQNSEVFIQ
jgi:UDP-N-acetylglucosamine/UDP-N-acetylgalactosamine diphosphorylase